MDHAAIDHTGLTGVGGSVATDTIWDAAGDLAVGSGSNTAAKLAKGAAGANLSTYNGVVAWNGGTSFPASPATGDRYWRSDLGLEFYYDGTRWVSVEIFEHRYSLGNAAANADLGYGAPYGGTDLWLIDFGWTYNVVGTHSGSAFWSCELHKVTAAGVNTTITTLISDKATSSTWINPAATAIGALLGTTQKIVYPLIAKTGSPGNLYVGTTLRYRIVGT